MDCQMPVMDGYTATQNYRLRESGSDERLPIIALTANALAEDRQKCIDAGMDDFISKPFKRDTLLAMLLRWKSGAVSDAAVAEAVVQESADSEPERDSGCIEPEALQQIADLDPESGNELVSSVIDTYIENTDTLIRDLRQAGETNDSDAVVAAAHALKSSSANVGANRLAKLCSAIETGARAGDLEQLSRELGQAANEHVAVVNELRLTQKTIAA
jgi:HPt (histidine-containing phosphotransfer) domain-containing protein